MESTKSRIQKLAAVKYSANKILDELTSSSPERRRDALRKLKDDSKLRMATLLALAKNPNPTEAEEPLLITLLKILRPYLDAQDIDRLLDTYGDNEDVTNILLTEKTASKKIPSQATILLRLLENGEKGAFETLFGKFYDRLSDKEKYDILLSLLKKPDFDLLGSILPLLFSSISDQATLDRALRAILNLKPLVAINVLNAALPGFNDLSRAILLEQLFAKSSEYRQAVLLPLILTYPQEERADVISRLANSANEEDVILASQIQSLYA